MFTHTSSHISIRLKMLSHQLPGGNPFNPFILQHHENFKNATACAIPPWHLSKCFGIHAVTFQADSRLTFVHATGCPILSWS